MRTFAITIMLLALAVSASAVDRVEMQVNLDAVDPINITAPHNGGNVKIVNQRDVTVFTDLPSFLAVLHPDHYFDNFDWLDWGTITGELTWPFGPVNGYSYVASAPGGLFSVPGAMSTNSPGDVLTLDFDGGPVFMVGGFFFATDFDGIVVSDVVNVTLNDGTSVDVTSVPGNPSASFVGFMGTDPITQLNMGVVNLANWVAYDDFYVGTVITTATEPITWSSVKALF